LAGTSAGAAGGDTALSGTLSLLFCSLPDASSSTQGLPPPDWIVAQRVRLMAYWRAMLPNAIQTVAL